MSALYLDSSAFVKLAVEEPDTVALRRYVAGSPGRRVSSALLRTEALRAVRYLGAEALATIRESLRRIDLVGIDDRILESAGMLEPRVLRTLDAIHLATGLAARRRAPAWAEFQFGSADRRLNVAATAESFDVFNPSTPVPPGTSTPVTPSE